MPRILSDEQIKTIIDNAGNSYETIGIIAKCSRTAVYECLKEKGLTIKLSGGNVVKKKKEKELQEQKKIVRHPAKYSNRDYSQAYL
mgnify:CR=1 FL=1